jgi:hypothetical protein
MTSDKAKDTHSVRLDLTPAQREQVTQQGGKEAEAIELKAEELEERVAPMEYIPHRSLF